MKIPRLYRIILPVSDIDLAAEFYGYVFQIDGERVSPGRHYFDCGGVILIHWRWLSAYGSAETSAAGFEMTFGSQSRLTDGVNRLIVKPLRVY